MLLEHISCDLCGCPDYRVLYRKPDTWMRNNLFQFPVVECTGCSLVYVNPRPTMAAMADFYPPGYHDNREQLTARYKTQHALLPALNGLKVLDIGCAKGDFLTHLLDSTGGFDAFGIDAFCDSVSDPRINFTMGTLEKKHYPHDFFDLVMSWAVFEHIHAPTAYFLEVARTLKPGGKLIILVTNADSLYGKFAQLEDVPRHTYHYSRTTLARYGDKANLRLRNIAFTDDIFDGRGKGTFRMLLGRLCGFTWERMMLGRLGLHHKIIMKIGSALDAIVFFPHWEVRLGKSGIMVATYEKF
jgi:SAM-dependent methyltransferase